MTAPRARHLWHLLEPVNAVTYFSPECREAPNALGLQGFWMGYFACRAAPMGPVAPGVVEATFYNFHPARVRRAIPDAWQLATAEQVVAARTGAAGAALRRLLGDGPAEALAAAVTHPLREVVAAASAAGRPLFAANASVPPPEDPVAGLWQLATTLREHRGDGHVALLCAGAIDGCEAHVLAAARTGVAPDLLQASRGWSPGDWAAAVERLASRGLVRADGRFTDRGRAEHQRIEDATDELAAVPLRVLDDTYDHVVTALEGPAARIAAAGEIAFPNPMGLPRPATPG